MGKSDRLGVLEVGEAGHDVVDVVFGELDGGENKGFQVVHNLGDLAASIETKVESNLVVTGTSGVETFAGVADILG